MRTETGKLDQALNRVQRTLRVRNFDISLRNKLMTSSYHNFRTPSSNSAEFKNEGIVENRQWQQIGKSSWFFRFLSLLLYLLPWGTDITVSISLCLLFIWTYCFQFFKEYMWQRESFLNPYAESFAINRSGGMQSKALERSFNTVPTKNYYLNSFKTFLLFLWTHVEYCAVLHCISILEARKSFENFSKNCGKTFKILTDQKFEIECLFSVFFI